MNKVDAYTHWLINLANDNSHGYSQANRWGPDYDCSSAVIAALEYAGFPVKSAYGATYTGNLKQALLKCGFTDVISQINLATGAGLEFGDICLNESTHVVVYIGSGKVVNVRGNDGHPEPGDQTGSEIRIQSYWDDNWGCIMRPPEEDGTEEPDDAIHPAHRRACYHLEYGDGCRRRGNTPQPSIRAWQNLLICWGFEKALGADGPDGEYGECTKEATEAWQKKAKSLGSDVEVNGVVDTDDWEAIIYVPVD